MDFKLPQRSRAHQLEDKSINEFKRLLPEQWVCREKGRDYGVDLEVEIFGEDGQATGIFFFVQLKATHDAARFDKLAIKVDRLRYLASLDIPAIIARYCEPTGTWTWLWNHDALAQVMKPNTQTVTLSLTSAWTHETPSRIESYISAIRRLRSAGPNADIFIEVENHTEKFHYFSDCEKALRRVANTLSFIKLGKGRPEDLKLSIQLMAESIKIELASVGNLDVGLSHCSYEELSAAILYGLPAVLHKMGLAAHAKSFSLYCLKENIRSPLKDLALKACFCLISEPLDSANLAILNEIHLEQDYYYASFVVALLEKGRGDNRYTQALEKLHQWAAKAATAQGQNPSAIFYSLGNSQASLGLYPDAISSFNRARKLEPGYLSRSYFLSELGGALFLSEKYRCSVAAYRAALSLEMTERIQFCLADAQLYAGSFEEASTAFEALLDSSDESMLAEVRLKVQLSRWFLYASIQAKPYQGKELHALMIQAIESGAMIDAHFALLALALTTPQNTELWAAFLQTSFFLSDHKTMLDAMVKSYPECGADAYAICRKRLLEAGEVAEETAEMAKLDSLFAEARTIDRSRAPTPATFRLVGENGPEAVFSRK